MALQIYLQSAERDLLRKIQINLNRHYPESFKLPFSKNDRFVIQKIDFEAVLIALQIYL